MGPTRARLLPSLPFLWYEELMKALPSLVSVALAGATLLTLLALALLRNTKNPLPPPATDRPSNPTAGAVPVPP